MCCIDCILTNHGVDHRESLVTVEQFIEKAVHTFQQMQKIKLDEEIPQKYTKFLSREDESLAELSQHIESTKMQVENVFNNITDMFLKLCQTTKDKLCKELDAQLSTFKINYKMFNAKINKIYGSNDEKSYLTGEMLISRINRMSTLDEFEYTIKDIKDDLIESKGLSSHRQDDFAKAMRAKLDGILEALSKDTEKKPIIKYDDLEFTQSGLADKILKEVNPLFVEKIRSCDIDVKAGYSAAVRATSGRCFAASPAR